jgi:hypothetical protein
VSFSACDEAASVVTERMDKALNLGAAAFRMKGAEIRGTTDLRNMLASAKQNRRTYVFCRGKTRRTEIEND